jgi:lipopolysaccharide export system protein LptC
MVGRFGGWLILLCLAVATTWWLQQLEDDSQTSHSPVGQVPDYTLGKFTTNSLDEQGQLKHQVTAATMAHYPNLPTDLTTPIITFYKNGTATWTVQAERGQVSVDNNQILLLGDTTFQRHTKTLQKSLKIISRDVRVQRDTEYAETQSPTIILSSQGETHSVGMRVFMPTEKIELLSQVRGRYVVQ